MTEIDDYKELEILGIVWGNFWLSFCVVHSSFVKSSFDSSFVKMNSMDICKAYLFWSAYNSVLRFSASNRRCFTVEPKINPVTVYTAGSSDSLLACVRRSLAQWSDGRNKTALDCSGAALLPIYDSIRSIATKSFDISTFRRVLHTTLHNIIQMFMSWLYVVGWFIVLIWGSDPGSPMISLPSLHLFCPPTLRGWHVRLGGFHVAYRGPVNAL